MSRDIFADYDAYMDSEYDRYHNPAISCDDDFDGEAYEEAQRDRYAYETEVIEARGMLMYD